MIVGGIGGVFRVGASKVGYSETFFPIAVDAASEQSVDNLINAEKAVKFTAKMQILNDLAEWVEVGDVTYASVTQRPDGTGAGNFSIANSKKWSVAGTQNPELLRPSYRQMQIVVTIKSGVNIYENTLFNGTIETYSESHGQQNGSITLSAKPFSASIGSRFIRGLKRYTVYRKIYDECMASGLFAVGQFPAIFTDDDERTNSGAVENLYLTTATLLSTMIAEIIAYQNIAVRGNGGLLVTFATQITEAEVVRVFNIDDSASISLTRVVGGASSYNTVIVQGLFNGVLTTQTYVNAEDVALRGTFQSPTVYGDPNEAITENYNAAAAWVAEMLRDKLSIQLRLNPFLTPGVQLRVSSDRLFMTNKLCRIGNITHTLSYGQATTTLSEVAVLEDA
jgi:hypothetical protein